MSTLFKSIMLLFLTQLCVAAGLPSFTPGGPNGEAQLSTALSQYGESNQQQRSLIDLSAHQKIEAVSLSLHRLRIPVSESQFSRFLHENDQLFDPSGYVNLSTNDGQDLSLTTTEFYERARSSRSAYAFQDATLVRFDRFRQNSLGKWYCRATTYHDVTRFENETPVPSLVTVMDHMPMLGKAPTKNTFYWQIFKLSLKEKK